MVRTHNVQNEVTEVASSSLTFDAAGNMTTDESGRTFTYDAWNRLADRGSSMWYQYDALGRRTKQIYTDPASTGGPTAVSTMWYSANWHLLEEQS